MPQSTSNLKVTSQRSNFSFINLFQVTGHDFWVAAEDPAEEFHNLLVVQVVHALNDPRQQQLHCQIEIPMETIWKRHRCWTSCEQLEASRASVGLLRICIRMLASDQHGTPLKATICQGVCSWNKNVRITF